MSAPSTQPTVSLQAGPAQFSGNIVPQSRSHYLPPPTSASTATSNHVATRMTAAKRLPTSKLDVFEEVIDSQVSYTDSSSALFALYLSHAEKHDRDQTDSWKADADGILVFTGLFAAALATFVIDSYKSLLPDSAGNTVILLAQISQQLHGLANGTLANNPPNAFLLQSTTSWNPPASAVWVNVLWFLSLVTSLFCALLATLQQRWARRYLQLTQPHLAIHKRAFIRSFFAEGVTRFHLAVAVEAIPALLHVSVFLFLAGLVVSLFNIHHTVAYVILASSVACAVVYAAITVMPAIFHDSPYTSPFSAAVWYVSRKTALTLLKTADHMSELVGYTCFRPKCAPLPLRTAGSPSKPSPFRARLSRDMTSTAHDEALTSDKGMIARALGWTLDRMDEEGEMVEFAAGIPGFFHSIEVKDAVSILEEAPKQSTLHPNLYRDITSLLIRSARPGTLPDSKLLPGHVRQDRVKVCLEALYFLPHAIERLLHRMDDQSENKKVTDPLAPMFRSVESWRIAERLSKASSRIHQDVTIAARCMAAVLARKKPNRQAEPIVMAQLNIEDLETLNRLARPGDSLLLKNLNNLLDNTALEYIDMDPEKFPIVISAARLVMKKLRIPMAEEDLRDEYATLLVRIRSCATGSSSSRNARMNAKKLLSVLSDHPVAPAPAPDAQAGPSAPSRPPHDAPTAAAATPLRTSRNSPPRPLHPVLQNPRDTYVFIASPTGASYPSSAYDDTYPLMYRLSK